MLETSCVVVKSVLSRQSPTWILIPSWSDSHCWLLSSSDGHEKGFHHFYRSAIRRGMGELSQKQRWACGNLQSMLAQRGSNCKQHQTHLPPKSRLLHRPYPVLPVGPPTPSLKGDLFDRSAYIADKARETRCRGCCLPAMVCARPANRPCTRGARCTVGPSLRATAEAWMGYAPNLQLVVLEPLIAYMKISSTFLRFFPRASERRVLLIVRVCISSSQLHTFSSSHLLIFTPSHLHIFSSSHLLIFTSSHLHIFSSSHLLIFTSSHLHIFSSSHLLIFTSAHLHIFSPSHLLIFTSAHLHIFSSSHLLIFTFAHLHIFSSSHLLTFTSSHLHICSCSHLLIFTSSHLHICSSSHLLIFTSSHTHIFSFSLSHSHLHILTSSLSLLFPLSFLSLLSLSSFSLSFFSPFSLSRLLYLSLFRPRVVPAGSHETSTLSHEMRVDAQKLRKNCDFTCAGATLSHEMRIDRQKLRKNCEFTCPRATLSHEMKVDRQKLRKNCEFTCPGATLSHEMRVDRQKLRKNCDFTCPGATLSHDEGRSSKTKEKLRF